MKKAVASLKVAIIMALATMAMIIPVFATGGTKG